ncbi:MAG TPA: hypothetical protein VIJ55_03755 [Acetobacteraceae bacterium]
MPDPAPDPATLRARIAELRSKRARIERAPMPERDALAAIEHQVHLLADTLPPITASNLDTLLRMKPGATLAKLLPEQLARTIAEDMRLGYANMTSKPLAPAARAKELARIDDQLRAAEIEEERAIRSAEARGEETDRRGEADPRVLLMEEIE